jgi:hypothetical protein
MKIIIVNLNFYISFKYSLHLFRTTALFMRLRHKEFFEKSIKKILYLVSKTKIFGFSKFIFKNNFIIKKKIKFFALKQLTLKIKKSFLKRRIKTKKTSIQH